MKDCLVIDIETKNTFADVGGESNLKDLDASLICVYSYMEDKFFSFREGNFNGFASMLQNAGLIVGFSITRFDLPVMDKYFKFNTMALPRFDILDEIETNYGRRVGLDILAKTNLGIGKNGHGLDAPKFYATGDWESLEKYCLNDVLITRDLYNLVKDRKHLFVPDRMTGTLIKVNVAPKEMEVANTLF